MSHAGTYVHLAYTLTALRMTIKPITFSRRTGTSLYRLLNELLISEYLLYTETRICHWHLEEQPTAELRNFLQRQYEMLDIMVDRVAIYMRAEGHRPVLRPHAFQHIRTFLANDAVPPAVTMLKSLKHAHAAIVQRLQKISRSRSIPAGAAVILEELTGQHKQMYCLLKAHLTLRTLQTLLSSGGVMPGQQ
jgi:DNA-binding ferritin-like protein